MQSYWREQMHFHLGALERCPAQQNERAQIKLQQLQPQPNSLHCSQLLI